MARIRSVHPSLFTDEAWVSCSPLARILYIALWTDADDQGLFEWKPLQIKMRLLPGDMTDIPPLLDELVSVDLILQYEIDGSKYGAIKEFRKFQRPQKPNAIHPLPESLREYVSIDGADKKPVSDHSSTDQGKAKQMEDGGWRMEDVESNLSPNGDCPPKADPLPVREAFDLWNELAGRIGLPVARDLTDKRRASIKSRLTFSGIDGWLEALKAVENSPMCRGENSRGWRADLDFVCQQKSFTKLIEGSYAGSPKQKENRNGQSHRSNRAEQRDAWAEILTQGHSESASGGEPLRITGGV